MRRAKSLWMLVVEALLLSLLIDDVLRHVATEAETCFLHVNRAQKHFLYGGVP